MKWKDKSVFFYNLGILKKCEAYNVPIMSSMISIKIET